MSSVSDNQTVDPDGLACIEASNFTERLFTIHHMVGKLLLIATNIVLGKT